MKRLPWCVWIGVWLSACTSEPPSTESALQIIRENESVTVVWNGKRRLSGGLPLLSGTEFKPTQSKVRKVEDGREFSFVNTLGRAVTLQAKVLEQQNVVGLFLSPKGNQSKKGTDTLGITFQNLPAFEQGIAFYRYGPVKAWTKPTRVQSAGILPFTDDVQFYLWQYQDNSYGAAMPLGGKGYNATLGNSDGLLAAKSVSLVDQAETDKIPVMALAFGADPYDLIDRLYQAGMEMMGRKENLRKYKKFPAPLERIGWCTWNAFGHNLNGKKLVDGVSTFAKQKFPLPLVLIDDGWMQTSGPNGQLKSFKPNSKKFPKGLKPVVDQLKNEHGVRSVGVWHTLNGYWGGIDKKSELGKKYGGILMPYRDKVTWANKSVQTFYAPTAASQAGFQFYDEWYTYLTGEGVSLVKVDNQLIIDRIARGNVPLWEAGGQVQKNLQRAVSAHFEGAVINCMGMSTNDLYHFGSSAVARSSEDYFPENSTYHMEHGNAAVHVLSNMYNSLWFSPVVWPDFDMFQSHHSNARYHAIARAISGGPIYLTDIPGKQRFDVLWPLIYRDGRIIRADMPARPTEDCLFNLQDKKPFKAFSFAGKVGLLGVWNAADTDHVEGIFKPSDVHGIEGERFVMYEYFSGKCYILAREQSLPVSLGRMGYQLYYVLPLNDGASPIGLLNKYNAPKTILRQETEDDEMRVTLPEGGTFGAYLPHAPTSVKLDGKPLPPTTYTWEKGLLKVPILDDPARPERQLLIEF